MAGLKAIPDLADLVKNSDRVSELPLEAVPVIRGELVRIDTLLQMRIAQAGRNGQGDVSDRLLDVKEVAAKLHLSEDQVYRKAASFPFTVRVGRKLLFSEAGIDRYIRQRAGR